MILMRKFTKPFLLFLLIVVVFHAWFLPGLLSTFDFPYFSPLMMKDSDIIPYTWGYHVGLDGFAGFLSPYSWVFPFIYAPQVIFGNLLGMDWSLITRITYLYPFLILSVISPALLFRFLFPKNNFYLLVILVFLFNTYALMLAQGEIFLALAYALAPMVLMIFFKIAENRRQTISIKYSVVAGLLLSAQIVFDPRIAYAIIFAVGLYAVSCITYYVLCLKLSKERILNTFYLILYTFVIPLGIATLLHAFWIIPTVLHGGNPVEALGAAHSAAGAVNYLSFAKLENTISLLQPNWPENIFGKVGFMKPEFLVLPVLAFASLLFINNLKEKREKLFILFFAFLGLVGAFLSKGTNDPFGGIYLWLFKYVPGFIMFRDPTKWYLLIALSYSILIPFTTFKFYNFFASQSKFQISNFKFQIKSKNQILNFQNLFLILTTLYLILLVRPAVFGHLGGLLKTTSVPQDYVKLEKFLVNQPDYFRTLWFPSKQRFSYYSDVHPEISAQVLFDLYDNKSLLKKLSEKGSEKLLEEASIKYVIVPNDSEGEIFLTDRKYDNKLYLETIKKLKSIKWLKQVSSFGKVIVFETNGSKNHFWSPNQNLKINYEFINPTRYEVNIENARKGDLIVFSESYDKNWMAEGASYKVESLKFNNRFNSFVLPSDGSYGLKVSYALQSYVNVSLIIGTSTLIICLGLLLYLRRWH
jgi:hypothetical protein